MTLYDQFGKQIQAGKPILQEVAVQTVRDRYSNYPSHGLTPERLAAILKEADQGYMVRQAELFEEMEEKDCHLGSVLQTRKRAVAGLEWEILPASDSPEDKRIADAGKEMLEYFEDFDTFLFDLLDAVGKGYSVQELMWAISEGQVWIESANWIHQKRFTFSGPMQTINGFQQQPLLEMPRLLTDAEPIYGENLLPKKFVFHRHKTRSGATARGGILRPCAYMYLFKNYDVKDWLIFNELFSVPMRVGKYKSGATPKEIDTLKTAVMNLGVDAAAVISENTIIEIVESAARGNVLVFKDLAEFCEKAMSKVVLGHAGSADSTPGKLGNETTADDVRQDLLESDAKPVSRTVKLQLLAPWVAYNFGPQAAVPKFRLLAEKGEDLKKKADVLGVLVAQVGFDQIPVSHIQEEFSIPKPVNGEPTVKPATQANPFGFSPDSRFGGPGQRTPQTAAAQTNKACTCGAQHHKRSQLRTTDSELLLQLNTASQEWVAEYMQRLQPALQGAQQSAVDDITTWLKAQNTPPTKEAFNAKIQNILGASYANLDTAEIAGVVADMYGSFKAALPIEGAAASAFGGADLRAINWLSEVDSMFYSKFITNPDAMDTVTRFLNEQYLKGGQGLFGRGDPAVIEEFRNLLAQKTGDISAYSAQRIADTSVQRIRNFSHLQQMSDAAIPAIRIVEPTEDCDFCRAINGKVIQVDAAYNLMQDLMSKTPEDYLAYLQANTATLDSLTRFIDEGALPPYHPNCHGYPVKA